jgi:hypothetical protein
MKIDAWLSIERNRDGVVTFYLCIEVETAFSKGWSPILITQSKFDRLKVIGLEVKQ